MGIFNLGIGIMLLGCFVHNESNRGSEGKALSTLLLFMAAFNILCGVLTW